MLLIIFSCFFDFVQKVKIIGRVVGSQVKGIYFVMKNKAL